MTVTGTRWQKAVRRSNSPAGKASIEGVAERLDLGRQRLDPAVGEGAQDEAAQARVAGRFEFEHRMRLDRVEGGDVRRDGGRVRGLAAEAAVLKMADRAVADGQGA